MRGTPESPSWQPKNNYAVNLPPHQMANPSTRHGRNNIVLITVYINKRSIIFNRLFNKALTRI